MFDKSYVYIRKDVLQKILPLGLSLRKMGLKLNVAPKTVQKKLRYHKLIGETETLQDAYKRMGIKTDKKRKLDKTRTEILNYFKPIYFNTMARQYNGVCTNEITNETMTYFQGVMDRSGLLQPPVFKWKIREMMVDILHPEYPKEEEEKGIGETEEKILKDLSYAIKLSDKEIKNHKALIKLRGPKVWSLVKYILKNYPDGTNKINFSKMSQNFGGIYPQKMKDILEHHNIDPYNIDLYKKEVIATIRIACHEVKIQKRGQRENVKKLADRLGFSKEADFVKMCEVLEIDWKQIYVDEMKIKLDYFAGKGYKNKEICKELEINEIELSRLINKVK